MSRRADRWHKWQRRGGGEEVVGGEGEDSAIGSIPLRAETSNARNFRSIAATNLSSSMNSSTTLRPRVLRVGVALVHLADRRAEDINVVAVGVLVLRRACVLVRLGNTLQVAMQVLFGPTATGLLCPPPFLRVAHDLGEFWRASFDVERLERAAVLRLLLALVLDANLVADGDSGVRDRAPRGRVLVHVPHERIVRRDGR